MQHKYKNTQEKKGFSLIELSIVILIVSILITGSLGISKTAINNSKAKVTKERMDTVYKALNNFVATNRRLPCPSRLDLAKGVASYGVESGSVGFCTGNNFVSSSAGGYTSVAIANSANANIANLVYGSIPVTSLGLDPDMMEDGFGTKFSYVVDARFTKPTATTASTDGFEFFQAMPAPGVTGNTVTTINVQGPSGTNIMTNALFVLISHGSNKFMGYNATGTTQNGYSTINDEVINGCNTTAIGTVQTCSTTSATRFSGTFVSSSTDANFDDILLFKNKTQLVRDAGLEFMMCNPGEAQYTSTGSVANMPLPAIWTWTLSQYGTISTAANSTGFNSSNTCRNAAVTGNPSTGNTNKAIQICGKYGVWSGINYINCP